MGKPFLRASGPWMKEQGVDEKRFDVVVTRLAASGSRRSVVWGAVAGALGLGGAVLASDSAEAKKKKRKKKKGGGGSTGGGTPGGGTPGGNNEPVNLVTAPALETCRATCGENCPCIYSPSGEISCGFVDNAGTCETCQSGDGCSFGTCVAGFYAVGQSTPTRFSCRYQYGICANLTSCEV